MEFAQADKFFAMARERYKIKLKRDAGEPPPWTDDKILQTYRFCNVHREHDATTVWFRENARDPLSKIVEENPTEENRLRLVVAIIAFRWFNRISTGIIIRDLLLNGWNKNEALRLLENVHPVCTGAFMLKSHVGMNKVNGLLHSIEQARAIIPAYVPKWGDRLQEAWADLCNIPYLGPFLSLQVTMDLRWTAILRNANDINTWCVAGPGAAKGLGLVVSGNPKQYNRNSKTDQEKMIGVMIELLQMSRSQQYWPQEWPIWELHEAEFHSCEFFKWCRGWEGESLKRRFP